MTDTNDNPLALFTWDELVAELRGRCESMVLAFERKQKVPEPNCNTIVNYAFSGGCLSGIGLCRFAERHLTRLLTDEPKDEDGLQ